MVSRSTPRDMLTRQNYLFCDESSMVLATIVHRLGYPAALINLVHHAVRLDRRPQDEGFVEHVIKGVRRVRDVAQRGARRLIVEQYTGIEESESADRRVRQR